MTNNRNDNYLIQISSQYITCQFYLGNGKFRQAVGISKTNNIRVCFISAPVFRELSSTAADRP